jgi:tRNA-splicing ligase RtcB
MTYQLMPGTVNPVRIWTDPSGIESAASQQLRNIGNLPWVEGVAVMPDVHYGIGATIGSVIAMKQALSPAAVGVDLGCGMVSAKTSLKASDLPDNLSPLRAAIEDNIPVGFNQRNEYVDPDKVQGLDKSGWKEFWRRFKELDKSVKNREDRAHNQMGTLGGGNHFIEVCIEQGSEDGAVWLMLHSGSRNIGKELAEKHISAAKELPHNQDLPDRDLAVFLSNTPEMSAYRHDLFWAQEYARRNRSTMMAILKNVIRAWTSEVQFEKEINCHHNYVAEETYGGVDLLVTRKGAIKAGVRDLGIIPGSMGTGSYIVRGKGNEDAYCSASHGAGRRMSRSKAKKMFTIEDLAEQTAGVECRKDSAVVDEIPGAYKDISEVMKDQEDLVEVVAHLKQVICVKG